MASAALRLSPRTALLLLAVGAACVSLTSAQPKRAISYGHGAYTYGPMRCTDDPCAPTPSCNKAEFANDIADYNHATVDKHAKINRVLSYGGDVELWGTKEDKTACWAPANSNCNASVFFDDINQAAAATYSKAEGVDTIIALVDGRMDGWDMIATYNHDDACGYGDFYPNLNNLTDAQINKLAEELGRLYCSDPIVRGVQVDLEPFKDPYTLSVSHFVGAVADVLRDEDHAYGCRTTDFPQGRSVSYFTFAHSQSPEFTHDVLGENGYYVFSLYDLDPRPEDGGFIYNTVEEFGDKMRYELNFIPAVVEDNGKFTLAIPIAASCHEYEEYRPMEGKGCGPACIPEKNSATMAQYVQKAFDVLLDPETTKALGGLLCMNETAQSQFVGLNFWVWTHEMTYPPMKWFSNDFLPVTPDDDVLSIIRKNLPKLADGTTCLTKDCSQASNRPNGCSCTHSYECESDWCTGTCTNKPTFLDNPPEAWTRQYGDVDQHKAAQVLRARLE